MNQLFYTYSIYVALSIALTVWVAHTLFKHGRAFLVDIFKGNEGLADSVNHLLVVGFYLVNFGYDSFALKTADPVDAPTQAFEVLSGKIGVVLLVLGTLHFTNLFVFSMIRRTPAPRTRPPIPPYPPQMPGTWQGTPPQGPPPQAPLPAAG